MINIHSVITGEGDNEQIGSEFSNLRGNCRIVLQVSVLYTYIFCFTICLCSGANSFVLSIQLLIFLRSL